MTFDEWLKENGYYAKDMMMCLEITEEEIDNLQTEYEEYCCDNDIQMID